MTRTWFTADTHFDHAFVAKTRGFDTAQDHDAAVVENWNATVAPGDTVWHLGDVTIGALHRALPWLKQLHGKIHLVSGNHDDVWPGHRTAAKYQRQWLDHFASVQPFARLRLDGTRVLLSHFPYAGDHTDTDRYREFRLHDTGGWLVHGHVHDEWSQHGRQINVGLDRWALAPVSTETIMDIIAKEQP